MIYKGKSDILNPGCQVKLFRWGYKAIHTKILNSTYLCLYKSKKHSLNLILSYLLLSPVNLEELTVHLLSYVTLFQLKPWHLFTMLYIFNSHLNYASQIWGQHQNSTTNRIFTLQKSAIRIYNKQCTSTYTLHSSLSQPWNFKNIWPSPMPQCSIPT